MPPVGFEPTISAGERPQTHALDRAATEIHVRGLHPKKNQTTFFGILIYVTLSINCSK